MPAPGFDKWQKCSGGMSTTDPLFSSQPNGMDQTLHLEYFDAVNGVVGQQWTPSGGAGSGEFNSTIEWDSMGNSAGVRGAFPSSKRPNPGEVSAFGIGGVPMGCMMYMGRSTGFHIPSLYAAETPDPYGQIPPGQDHYYVPQTIGVSMAPFSDCNSCVYGAVDPKPPHDGWELDADNYDAKIKLPPKPGKGTVRDRQNKERRPSGEDNERKELREEVYKIKRLIGY
jgi:hypothetical protein